MCDAQWNNVFGLEYIKFDLKSTINLPTVSLSIDFHLLIMGFLPQNPFGQNPTIYVSIDSGQ